MTMLIHTRGPIERNPSCSRGRDTAAAAAARARLTMIKQFCISALTVVAAGCVLVAIMALKVMVYLPRFHH
jgi:hypothetical protein